MHSLHGFKFVELMLIYKGNQSNDSEPFGLKHYTRYLMSCFY